MKDEEVERWLRTASRFLGVPVQALLDYLTSRSDRSRVDGMNCNQGPIVVYWILVGLAWLFVSGVLVFLVAAIATSIVLGYH